MAAVDICSLLQDEKFVESLINGEDECGQTLLIRTIFTDDQTLRRNTLEALLLMHVNAWALDAYRRNALMWACLFRRDYEISRLLQYASPMELLQADIYGNTALHLAVTSGSAAAVKLIKNFMVEHALSLDIENSSGVTPKMEALRLGHDVCYSLLTQRKTLPKQSEDSLHFEDTTTYEHCRRRPPANVCSSLSSLPPLLPLDLKNKMKSFDIKACYQLADENPSNFLRKVCWKKNESTTQQSHSEHSKRSRFPSLAANNNEQLKTPYKALMRGSLDSNYRLPDITLPTSKLCRD